MDAFLTHSSPAGSAGKRKAESISAQLDYDEEVGESPVCDMHQHDKLALSGLGVLTQVQFSSVQIREILNSDP